MYYVQFMLLGTYVLVQYYSATYLQLDDVEGPVVHIHENPFR